MYEKVSDNESVDDPVNVDLDLIRDNIQTGMLTWIKVKFSRKIQLIFQIIILKII